jgi:transcriptional regulator with XRE-family HTH domain
MQEPGQMLRRTRERLHLRYRDIEEASQRIAYQRGNHEFLVGLSRLADIENKGTVPSIYRLYSLCAIYRLDYGAALSWYGVHLEELAADAAKVPLEETHLINLPLPENGYLELPELESGLDLRRTSYLSRQIQRWGRVPAAMLRALDPAAQRYGFIGLEDWSMYPILAPGSFVQIDESKRRVARGGWAHENERPVYFIEHREGFRCGWCVEREGVLVIQAHSTSHVPPEIYKCPGEAEIVGQVVGVAMRLDLGRRRHTHS